MRRPFAKYLVFGVLFLTAAALRLPRLELRPLHTDEAVHAVKFGALLDEGYYRYDSEEYHGPTLNYFTLVPAWLARQKSFKEIEEWTLRIVPVFFGLSLVVFLLFLADALGWSATGFAVLWTAVSPAFVYYSRYYIQEMLLVFFTFSAMICGYKWLTYGKKRWAFATGVSLGLMHATKETCIIAFGAMALSLFAVYLIRWRKWESPELKIDPAEKKGIDSGIQYKTGDRFGFPGAVKVESAGEKLGIISSSHIVILILAAIVISALFYSSFFANPRGVLDSLMFLKTYLTRAGQNGLHIHPWYFYFHLLFYFKKVTGPVFSELWIVFFALIGMTAAFLGKGIRGADLRFLRFISVYTLILTLIYCVLPYKTPWNLLGFWHGYVILAGTGVVVLLTLSVRSFYHVVIVLVAVIAAGHLLYQSYLGNCRYYCHPANPYVYAHTDEDIFAMTGRIKEVALAQPEGEKTYIEVICEGADYWPLPWYLREFDRVGWWSEVDMNNPAAPIIIASPGLEQEVLRKVYVLPPPGEKHLYVPLFDSVMELRPGVELRGYVKKEAWDRYIMQKNG